MSELKATTAQEIVQNEKDCDYMDELFGGVKMPPTQVYLKSEADKVIAELKAQKAQAEDDCAYWKMSEGNAANAMHETEEYAMQLYKESRHQKHKRCLALHDYCLCELEFAFRDPCIERSIEGCVRWRKWANLWLELAENFKEEK